MLSKVDATATKNTLTAIQMKMDIKLGGLGLRVARTRTLSS